MSLVGLTQFFIGQKEENDIEISSCILRSERPA